MARKLVFHFALLALAFVFVALCGSASSPLIPASVFDYSVWCGVADSWLKGLVPASEIFDNKGPVLHLIYLIGAVIAPGKWGVYFLESFALWASIELFILIGREFSASRRRISLAVTCILFLLMAFIFTGGTNEEFSLPFALYPLLVAIRFFRSGTFSPKAIIASGACCAIIAFIRLNNLVVDAAVVVAISVQLFRQGQFRLWCRIAALFFFGFVMVAIPILIYFAAIGALGDMIYNTLIFNFFYKARWGVNNYSLNIFYLLSCFILADIAFLIPADLRRRYGLLLFLLALFTLLTFVTGPGFNHYFIMSLPVVFLAVIFLQYFSLPLNALALAIILVPSFIPAIRETCTTQWAISPAVHDALPSPLRHGDFRPELTVPNSLRNQYILSRIDAPLDSVYIAGHISLADLFVGSPWTPVGKYTFQQTEISRINNDIHRDIIRHFRAANPAAIVSLEPIDIPATFHTHTYTLHRILQPTDSLPYIVYIYHR